MDPYKVIAAGRARGLPTRTIARHLGLRDGETAFGIAYLDGGADHTPTPLPEPVKYRLIKKDTLDRAARLADSSRALMRRLENSADLAAEIEAAACAMAGRPLPRSGPITFHHVMTAVCAAFSTSEACLRGPSHVRADVMPRFAFVELAAQHVHGTSLTKMGHFLNRDHTSILNARRRARVLTETDPAWRAKYEAAEAMLTGPAT